jgi:site-specific DNA-methyltransferase (adenine-specific)
MAVAVEDSGFEVRDMIAWISNKTFPKSHNVEKSTGSSDWAGWGTALKPSLEPVVMARKPLVGTVAENVLLHGTGALNIDGTRIGTESVTINTFDNGAKPWGDASGEAYTSRESLGRWPSNVMLDEFTAGLVDEQSGISKPSLGRIGKVGGGVGVAIGEFNGDHIGTWPSDNGGGASRFFYVARASKHDRNEGIEANSHPTVKPTDLMRQLVRLVTPPGGVVLDPFTGSGSTGKAAILEGFEFIGCELTEEYLPIIEGRLRWASEQVDVDDTLF